MTRAELKAALEAAEFVADTLYHAAHTLAMSRGSEAVGAETLADELEAWIAYDVACDACDEIEAKLATI